jgi:hypothetical protein
MGLEKSIHSGKEHRKEYRDSRRFDRHCRNHGPCDYCEGNRTHFDKKQRVRSKQEMKEFYKNYE